ncbi:MAG: ATP-binding cassette domain-containing protein [Chitinivibrionales bacterium]|nr:ATP-binding cassette domain-containing protein [Chitinivibrionales bacterium]
MATIDISNLSHTYPDGTRALRGVSLRVPSGAALGIVGPNGAGKSTFVNHLNGYLLPGDGAIMIDDIPVAKRTRDRIRRAVGVVFQNADDQLFMSRLYDDIAFGPRNLGLAADVVAARVEATMRDLGLWELRDRAPFHLSQGRKRFAAVATVLVMRPEVIVMDEPTADLDPRNRRHLIQLVKNLTATRIIVSHDLDFVWDTCGQVVVLADGAIAAQGPAHQLLADRELLERNGLELPLGLRIDDR